MGASVGGAEARLTGGFAGPSCVDSFKVVGKRVRGWIRVEEMIKT